MRATVVTLVLSLCGCPHREPAANSSPVPSRFARNGNDDAPEAAPGEISLLPLLRHGAIDVAGPVVDLGEPQAASYLVSPLPAAIDASEHESWTPVAARVRVRVPVTPDAPPNAIRIRLRRVNARGVVAIVDGLLARQAVLPAITRPATVTLPVAPDRFRRDTAEIELRFFGLARANAGASAPTAARGWPGAARAPEPVAAGAPRPNAPRVLAELDWIHLVRDATPAPGARPGDVSVAATTPPPPPSGPGGRPRPPPLPAVWVSEPVADARNGTSTPRVLYPPTARVADLVADVRAGGAPRRALALYTPTAVSTVTVIPPRATLRAALSAEGIHGAPGHPGVMARVRVETDGAPPIELRERVRPGEPWRDITLDLGALAGKAARISVAAEDGGDTRLAVADPRLAASTTAPPAAPPPVRHAVLVVVRGARYDRFAPTISPRLSFGGFARLVREGVVARAVAPSARGLAALASAVTGLPADLHGVSELTDTLDESAPTMAETLREAGVATAGFTDDGWWLGSGLDRGYVERVGCPEPAVYCRAEAMLTRAGDWLVAQRERRAFAMVVTRAGTLPFDPPPEVLAAVDPSPYEGAITPEQSAQLAARSRRGALALDARESERLAALYDASLAGVDRGLATLLERLREAGTLGETAVVVVGDRGSALGESGLLGEGPMSLAPASHTVLMVRAPGIAPAVLGESASVLDAAATVLERLGALPRGWPGERAGAASLAATRGAALHPRGVALVASPRGDLGLRFGELLALGRNGGLALIQPEQDPLGQTDVSPERPIARAFAETTLAAYRAGAAEEPRPRAYTSSTRALPPALETAMRASGLLRH